MQKKKEKKWKSESIYYLLLFPGFVKHNLTLTWLLLFQFYWFYEIFFSYALFLRIWTFQTNPQFEFLWNKTKCDGNSDMVFNILVKWTGNTVKLHIFTFIIYQIRSKIIFGWWNGCIKVTILLRINLFLAIFPLYTPWKHQMFYIFSGYKITLVKNESKFNTKKFNRVNF